LTLRFTYVWLIFWLMGWNNQWETHLGKFSRGWTRTQERWPWNQWGFAKWAGMADSALCWGDSVSWDALGGPEIIHLARLELWAEKLCNLSDVFLSFRTSDHNISQYIFQYITIIPVININGWSTGTVGIAVTLRFGVMQNLQVLIEMLKTTPYSWGSHGDPTRIRSEGPRDAKLSWAQLSPAEVACPCDFTSWIKAIPCQVFLETCWCRQPETGYTWIYCVYIELYINILILMDHGHHGLQI